MRWFGRILAHAFARRIALVIVAGLLAWAGIGRAEAACNQTSGRAWSCTTQAEAATKIAQVGSVANCQAVYGGNWEIDSFRKRDLAPGQLTIYGECYGAYNGNPKVWNVTWEAHYTTSGGCTGSTSWDPVKVECASACPTGWDIDPYAPGQCLDAQKCQARNAQINTEVMRVGGDVCVPVGGCAFEASSSDIASTMVNNAGSMVRARYSYSGRPASACPGSPEGVTPEEQDANKPSDTKQKCTQLADQTVCVRPDGLHCYSINGKPNLAHCWQPGETGQKTQEDTAQKRDAGPSEIPPNLNLPNGDTLQKVGQSVTTTTTKTVNNVTTVTTTTTTNYKTQNGTNAGTQNQAQPADGTGDAPSDGNTASGGGDCATKPVVSDPAMEMIATQAWATRCAIRAGNAVKVTGDVSDCSQPFTVQGDTAGMSEGENRLGVEQLKALRKSYCGDTDTDAFDPAGVAMGAVDGVADSTGTGDAAYTDGSKGGGGFGEGEGPDDTGLGYTRTCPNLPTVEVLGQSVDFDAVAGGKLCDWIQLGGYFVLLIAAMGSARLLVVGGN